MRCCLVWSFSEVWCGVSGFFRFFFLVFFLFSFGIADDGFLHRFSVQDPRTTDRRLSFPVPSFPSLFFSLSLSVSGSERETPSLSLNAPPPPGVGLFHDSRFGPRLTS